MPASVVQLAQTMLLRDFRVQQLRTRFAVLRASQLTRQRAADCFQPSPAPGLQPTCRNCRNYAHSPMLVCAIYPDGPDSAECRDYVSG